MLCENCNMNEATVHFTEIRNGVQMEHHLCSECAAKLEVPGYLEGMNSEFPFVQLLTGLLAAGGLSGVQQDTPLQHVICPRCGMNYHEFTRVGKFGCAECYNVFGPLIDDNLKCIHGDNVHCGKKYQENETDEHLAESTTHEILANVSDSQQKKEFVKENIEELHLKLREAIEVENFEEAARLRDEIKTLKGGK